jgi:hypothetical protein
MANAPLTPAMLTEQAMKALCVGDYSNFTGSRDYAFEKPAFIKQFLRIRPIIRRPTKCPSCGSREFVAHHGQTVCSYCRSAA